MEVLRERAEEKFRTALNQMFETSTKIRDSLRELQGEIDFSRISDERLVDYSDILEKWNLQLLWLTLEIVKAECRPKGADE